MHDLASHVPPPPDAPGPQGQILDFVDNLQRQNAQSALTPPPLPNSSGPGSTAKVDAPLAGFSFFRRKATKSKTSKSSNSEVFANVPPPQARSQTARTPPPVPPVIPAKAKSGRAQVPVPVPRVLAKAEPRRPPKPQSRWVAALSSARPRALNGLIAVAAASGVFAYQYQLPPFSPARITTGGIVAPGTATAVNPNLLPIQSIAAHGGAATHAIYTSDGRTVLTTGADGTLKIWAAPYFALQHVITFDDGPATSIATSGSRALTGHTNGRVVLWDIANGRRLGSFKRNDAEVWSVAFLENDKRFAAASHDWKVAIWEVGGNEPRHVMDAHDNAVQSVAFASTQQGPMLVTGSADKTVRLWNSGSYESQRRYRGHSDFISALAIKPDGSALASASFDGNIRVWSAKSHATLRRLYGHQGPVGALAFAPTGDVLVSAGQDGKIRLWDLKGGRAARVLPGTIAGQNDVTISPDGSKILAAGADGKLHVWTMPQTKVAGRGK